MKKKRTFVTIFLVIATFILVGVTIYISSLLSSSSSPTRIQKTKAAGVTYTRKVDLFPTGTTEEPSISVSPTVILSPTVTLEPTLLAQAPTLVPTKISTPIPSSTIVPPVVAPTSVATLTLQPLLAYKSTTISPTLAPATEANGSVISPTKTASPITKIQPTGVQQLPDTGWVQISSILFVVAASTILFSLLF